MLNCRHVTRLVSKSMDAKLRWYQRVAIRVHLLYCVWCRRYAAQIRFLRKATKAMAAGVTALAPTLSVEVKEQMRKRLQEASKIPPSSRQ